MLSLSEIFEVSNVKQAPGGVKYFALEHRTCHHTGNFVTAVETALLAGAKEELRQTKEKAAMESNLRAKIDTLRDELRKAIHENVLSRLEQESTISEHSRDRIAAPLAI
tara:strand:+ start:505 stop:831 length:327 start_codon:yes stop_codon:yes gene_type:complete